MLFKRGYKLIEKLGAGNFGSVYLSQKGTENFSVKFLNDCKTFYIERENLKTITGGLKKKSDCVKGILCFKEAIIPNKDLWYEQHYVLNMRRVT